jgi:hypothetical protein
MSAENQSTSEQQEFLLQFFIWTHLPTRLAQVSQPFGELAQHIVAYLPRNPERTVCLRKLLEAKDCAVRALLAQEHENRQSFPAKPEVPIYESRPISRPPPRPTGFGTE